MAKRNTTKIKLLEIYNVWNLLNYSLIPSPSSNICSINCLLIYEWWSYIKEIQSKSILKKCQNKAIFVPCDRELVYYECFDLLVKFKPHQNLSDFKVDSTQKF